MWTRLLFQNCSCRREGQTSSTSPASNAERQRNFATSRKHVKHTRSRSWHVGYTPHGRTQPVNCVEHDRYRSKNDKSRLSRCFTTGKKEILKHKNPALLSSVCLSSKHSIYIYYYLLYMYCFSLDSFITLWSSLLFQSNTFKPPPAY